MCAVASAPGAQRPSPAGYVTVTGPKPAAPAAGGRSCCLSSLSSEGSERAHLTSLIVQLNLGEHVTLLGAKPTTEVVPWLHASHVFLLPSRTEGTPTVLLEAQASGMPVIATDVGGVVDIVGSGRSGFVVHAEDPAVPTERLQYVLDRPEEWARMDGRARAAVCGGAP